MIDLERYDEWGRLDTAQLMPAHSQHQYMDPAAIEKLGETSTRAGRHIESLQEHACYMESLREKLADELEVHGLLARDLSAWAIQRGHTADCQTATATDGDPCSCGLSALVERMDDVLGSAHGSGISRQSPSS